MKGVVQRKKNTHDEIGLIISKKRMYLIPQKNILLNIYVSYIIES